MHNSKHGYDILRPRKCGNEDQDVQNLCFFVASNRHLAHCKRTLIMLLRVLTFLLSENSRSDM